MKIAFLSPFYPYRGGIARFSDSLYTALAKLAEIKAFSMKRQYPKLLFPGTSQFVSDKNIIDNINASKLLDSINPFNWAGTAKKIIDYKPDLLIQPYWMPFFASAFGKVAGKVRKKGIKVISLMHNVVPHEKRIGDISLTKYFLNRSDAFVLLSETNRKDLEELKPGAKYTVHTHPFYNDYEKGIPADEARKKLNLPIGKKVLLYFGFIRDYKGLDLLIESLKFLDESYILVIAGEVYGDFAKYQQQIDKLNLGERIFKFTRYIPDDEIPVFFSAADVCVLTYKSATQSGIVGISYNFDIPLIVTDVGGFKEQVIENETALIVKSLDPGDIADAIKKYFSENFKDKFKPAISALKTSNSWENLAKSILDLYNSL